MDNEDPPTLFCFCEFEGGGERKAEAKSPEGSAQENEKYVEGTLELGGGNLKRGEKGSRNRKGENYRFPARRKSEKDRYRGADLLIRTA